MATYQVVTSTYAKTFRILNAQNEGKYPNNEILMGSYVKILPESQGDWQKVEAFNIEGWINKSDLGTSPGLKIFYVDVGQGDGALLEVGSDEQGIKMLIDTGPGNNMIRYLNGYQFKYQRSNHHVVHFDYIFISHFDKDHFACLADILNDTGYSFGTIFHNGIMKFNTKKANCPAEYNTALGKKVKFGGKSYLATSFSSIEDLVALKNKGGMQDQMETLTQAIVDAHAQGRLDKLQRLNYLDGVLVDRTINNLPFKIEVLGPITEVNGNETTYKYFSDESHTINGHSLVLQLSYGDSKVFFGGDLNIPSEELLIEHYHPYNPFDSDVAKSCHHGASEFTLDFMKCLNPYATVISSGDNESFSHPRADALGCAGKYTKSYRPLIFSTELARSTNIVTKKILYGLINLRSDGEHIIMAQMKEVRKKGDVWDLYEVK